MKQEEKSLFTRKKILASAELLFSQKGYDSTTMQDIMNESELSKGAIYHHFSSKEEILKAMISTAQTQINEYFLQIADNHNLSVKEKVASIIQQFAINKNHDTFINNHWVEKVPFALLSTIRNGNDFIAPQISKIIQQGVSEGEFNCEHPEELAEILVLLLDVWLDPVITHRSSIEFCNRLNVLYSLLDFFGAKLLTIDDMNKIKEFFSIYGK